MVGILMFTTDELMLTSSYKVQSTPNSPNGLLHECIPAHYTISLVSYHARSAANQL